MNLNIRQANATKSYVVTDVCTTRPRIAIKNGNNVSYLPLTTSAKQGFGLRNKVNGVNYRPLEYQSMSTSATYYTTAVASNGLSSTTALTRSSTSQTIYHTCSSTSGTSYLTRSSTSGTSYLTALGTNITESFSMTGSDRWYYQNAYRYGTSNEWGQGIYKSTYPYGNGAAATLTITFGTSSFSNYAYDASGYQHLYYYHNITYRNATIYCYTATETRYQTFETNSPYSHYTTSSVITRALYSTSNYTGIWRQLSSTALPDVITYITMSTRYYNENNGATAYSSTYQRGYEVLTTSTSYLTRSSTSATSYLTRSSTSRTEYKTRASTSGYSGVSSSSSQSSGWL